MKDLKLTQDGDLAIDTFDLALVDGRAQVAQRMKTRLKTFLGEWYLNTDRGVPYFEDVFVKDPDTELVNAVLQDQILLDPEITEILTFTAEYDNSIRKMRFTTTVQTVYGTIPVEDTL